jgi:uncharacterized protein RhaS with RHS repeats
VTQYAYDANQNLIKITKPEENTVECDYNERDLPMTVRVINAAARGQRSGL